MTRKAFLRKQRYRKQAMTTQHQSLGAEMVRFTVTYRTIF